MQTEESQKQGADTAIVGSPAPPNAAAGSCGWMEKNEAKDGDFMTNLKHRFSGFIHAPMDEHKACFKTTMEKMAKKFSLSPKPRQNDCNICRDREEQSIQQK